MEGYKKRMQKEYNELGERIIRLENMLNKQRKGELEFEFDCPIDLLERQLDAMREYFKILEERAAIEDVPLSFSATAVGGGE